MNKKIQDYKDAFHKAIDTATRLGASAASINFSHGESEGIGFENGRLKSIGSSETMSYGISVIVNGKRGSATGNQPEQLDSLVHKAVELASIGAKSYFDTYPAPADHYVTIKQFDPAVTALTRQRFIDDSQNLVDFLKDLDPTLVISAGGGHSQGESYFLNNAGLICQSEDTVWNIGADFQKTTGTDMLQCNCSRSDMALSSLYDLDYIKNTLAEDLRNSARFATIPDGTCPLIVPPKLVSRFLAPVKMGLSGRSVAFGSSPLKDKLGQTVFSPDFTLEDNPHIDFMPSSDFCDDVGIPTQRRLLVENGRINLFLYDYDTACMVGAQPTGNSGCAPYVALLKPGQETSANLFKALPRALYIKDLLGFGQSNFANGDFSANVELGFVMEHGEITGRVKNTMISGNILEMLATAIQISSDTNPANLQPYLIFPSVNVFSK